MVLLGTGIVLRVVKVASVVLVGILITGGFADLVIVLVTVVIVVVNNIVVFVVVVFVVIVVVVVSLLSL